MNKNLSFEPEYLIHIKVCLFCFVKVSGTTSRYRLQTGVLKYLSKVMGVKFISKQSYNNKVIMEQSVQSVHLQIFSLIF